MAKSLSPAWDTQWRRLGRAQYRALQKSGSWLERIDFPFSAPVRARHPAPGQPAPHDLPGAWQELRLPLAPLPGELVPQLSYRLYIPSRAKGALPVMVMLHGCQQTPENLAAGTRMNALAEREGFIVAYPQQPLRRSVHRCWQWFDLGAGVGGREAQAVSMLIDELAARPDVRSGEIYLAGLSAGAAMAAVVALRYPGKVAAVGLHSGVVIGAADTPAGGLKAMREGSETAPAMLLDAAGVTLGGPEMPAIVLHGLDDDAVNPLNGRLLARQFLAYNGLSDQLGQRLDCANDAPPVGEGECREARFGRWGRDLVRLVEVAGLGHAWSGGDAAVPYHSALGPDASWLMWQFFRQHRRMV
ncbi:PHB depolymerase family esterase [Cupriavidus sp. SW-Y-13]|uniref:extracellular catalytic domain type 1 short-chain-length polyhydroxyalkanoate depolymerase n=1 Tax=Cupriavidus sp. SW-Y-13 TaxID=2653854 RepID=UPI0013656E5E|nr:PHB depolymerase family esterase [Cupriavidus sp. SW-Y-13]MWL90306.1 poly(3-hydroxybutyrate) depolymerase [Cupriavidus sp. SW-Y-13]